VLLVQQLGWLSTYQGLIVPEATMTFAFEAELQAAGKLVHTERLRSDGEASRIGLKAGQRFVTDGPFAKTKEILGGFLCDRVRHAERGHRVGEEDPAARRPYRRDSRGLAEVTPGVEVSGHPPKHRRKDHFPWQQARAPSEKGQF
jgi:hypothetical protein